MAQKSITFNIRLNPDIKESVEALYQKFGITLSDAINMFLHKSLIECGLPFALNQKQFNESTEKVIADARLGKGLGATYPDFDSMWSDLNV